MAVMLHPATPPPPREPRQGVRVTLDCVNCRYGVVAAIAPERCPMCGGSVWEHARVK